MNSPSYQPFHKALNRLHNAARGLARWGTYKYEDRVERALRAVWIAGNALNETRIACAIASLQRTVKFLVKHARQGDVSPLRIFDDLKLQIAQIEEWLKEAGTP